MPSQPITIRPFAGTAETTTLSQIWLDACLIAHSFIGKQRLIEQRSLIEDQYLPHSETWVATIDGAPAGFISLLDSFVGGLFVAPQMQGRGIGRRLIDHAMGLRGELDLDVYVLNAAAMRFYRQIGFQEVSRRAVDDEGLPFEKARLRLAGAAA